MGAQHWPSLTDHGLGAQTTVDDVGTVIVVVVFDPVAVEIIDNVHRWKGDYGWILAFSVSCITFLILVDMHV